MLAFEKIRFAYGKAPVRGLCWSPDGKFLAAVTVDHLCHVFDVASEAHLATLNQERESSVWDDSERPTMGGEWPSPPAFSPNGEFLAMVDYREIRVWRVPGFELSETMPQHGDAVTALSFSPDHRRVALGHWGGVINIREFVTAKEQKELRGPLGWVTDLCWCAGGDQLIACYSGGEVGAWTLSTGEFRRLADLRRPPTSISVATDDRIAVVTDASGCCRILFLEAARPRSYWSALQPARRASTADTRAAFAHSGRFAAIADGAMVAVDGRSGARIVENTGDDLQLMSLAWSPCGTRLYAGTKDAALAVFDADLQLICKHDLEGIGPVTYLQMSDGGDTLLGYGLDGRACIWDVATQLAKPLDTDNRSLGGYTNLMSGTKKDFRFGTAALAPDATLAATLEAGDDGLYARLWQDQRLVHEIKVRNGRSAFGSMAQFSRDARLLCIAGADFIAPLGAFVDTFCCVVDLTHDECHYLYNRTQEERGVICSMHLDPNDDLLAFAGTHEDALRIYSVRTFEEVAVLSFAPYGRVDSLRWSPSGEFVAACGDMGVCIWSRDGQQIARTIDKGARGDLAWSPDSRAIGFVDGLGEPCVLNLAGLDVRHSGST